MSNLTKQAVKKTGRARKETIVAELIEKIDSTNGLVFTDYKGISHVALEDLKRSLKKQDSTMIIAKNSLLRISLGKSQKYADFKDNEGLDLPTATLLIRGDMVEPLKMLQKAIKESGLPKIKFGILEGQLLDENGVLKIASLPNRETLLAQFVGVLNSPIQGFITGLNAIPQKFVMTLDAVASAKQNAEPAEVATEVRDNNPAEVATEVQTTAKPEGKPADEMQSDSSAEPAGEPAGEMQNDGSAEVQEVKIDKKTLEKANASKAALEEAVSANEPAMQKDAPVETDELADAGTETKVDKPEEQTEDSNKNKQKEPNEE